MSEKARGGLFNALGDIDGLTVLDAFTGSGALGFEAISRGADQITALDIDKNAISSVIKSAKELGIPNRIKAIQANASSWLATQPNQRFDIVLLDPPYDSIDPPLLTRLAERAISGGIIVLSQPPKVGFTLAKYELLTVKPYGDAQLTFYRA